MARQWRDSSKRRCAKLGRQLELPSIDAVHTYLIAAEKVCEYCRVPLGTSKKTKPNLDHRLPIARGGTADVANLALACGPCNRVKGEMTVSEYMSLRTLVQSWEDSGKDLFRRLKLAFYRY